MFYLTCFFQDDTHSNYNWLIHTLMIRHGSLHKTSKSGAVDWGVKGRYLRSKIFSHFFILFLFVNTYTHHFSVYVPSLLSMQTQPSTLLNLYNLNSTTLSNTINTKSTLNKQHISTSACLRKTNVWVYILQLEKSKKKLSYSWSKAFVSWVGCFFSVSLLVVLFLLVN